MPYDFSFMPNVSLVVKTSLSIVLSAATLTAAAQATPAPTVAARTWAVFDPQTNKFLASHEATTRIIPASLTKVMTAYLVFEAIRDRRLARDQMVSVSLNAYRVDKASSKMYIDPKVPVSIQDLLHGLIIQSGNDAAVQLAEAVAGTEETFAAMMTKKAAELGMKNTRFQNASGLHHPDNYSTAEDLAILAGRLVNDFPEDYKIYSKTEYTYNNIKQGNRNLLLYSFVGADGIKTGYTSPASGYNLIGSAKRTGPGGDYRVITVVTGAQSAKIRAAASESLLNWSFANFEAAKLASKEQQIGSPAVWKGLQQNVKAGFAQDLYDTIAKGTAAKLKTEVVYQTRLVAPIAKGTKLGVAKVTYDGKPVAEIPVVALEEVKEAGFFARLWDTVRMTIG